MPSYGKRRRRICRSADLGRDFEDFLDIVGADERSYLVIGRLHLGLERRQIGHGDLHAEPFEFLDLIILLADDQLPHFIAGRFTFLAEDGLLILGQFCPGTRAHRLDHVVVDVFGER